MASRALQLLVSAALHQNADAIFSDLIANVQDLDCLPNLDNSQALKDIKTNQIHYHSSIFKFRHSDIR